MHPMPRETTDGEMRQVRAQIDQGKQRLSGGLAISHDDTFQTRGLPMAARAGWLKTEMRGLGLCSTETQKNGQN